MAKHVVSQKINLLIFVTLLLMTLITVDVAFYNFGWLNIYIALTIATIKATLVVLYFMHLRYSERLNMVFVAAGVFWLIIMIALTAGDIFTRDWEPNPQGWPSIILPSRWW
jgi:cytochrome c oxidase subunit 4